MKGAEKFEVSHSLPLVLVRFWEGQTASNISTLQAGHDGIFQGAAVTGQ